MLDLILEINAINIDAIIVKTEILKNEGMKEHAEQLVKEKLRIVSDEKAQTELQNLLLALDVEDVNKSLEGVSFKKDRSSDRRDEMEEDDFDGGF